MATVTAPPRIALRNILVATDFSPCAQSALKHALNLTQHYGSTLYMVNVLPHTPFVEWAQPDYYDLRSAAEKKMRDFVRSADLDGIKHFELIEDSEVADVLYRVVDDHQIDLIVLGTAGREGFDKLLLGSVAEEVFRNADCPVLTVGPHVWPGALADRYRHILYATDFGVESVHALPYAVSLAEEHRARLTMVHVAHDERINIPEPSVPVMSPDELLATGERRLHEMVPEPNSLHIQPEFIVEFGDAADTILRMATSDVDLIVLGVKRGRTLAKHLGGSVAYRVAAEAHCPVLSVSRQIHD